MMREFGFTLIEVMIAMTICALVGIAAMQASGDHINHLTIIEQQQYASYVAENQVVEMNLETQWPLTDKKKGDEEQAGVKYYWQHHVTKTTMKDMVEIQVKVFSDEALEHELYSLTSFLAKSQSQ